MGAGAEGLAGVDDEVDRALARLLPGGPQPEALADQQRLVEVAPAVGPVVGDLGRGDLDQALADRGLELAQLGQLALAAVDRVLDVAGPALLLDPVRAPARSARRGPARPARAGSGPRGGSPLPKARRTRPKRPSPWRGPRLSRLERLVEPLGQLALLLAEVGRDDDLDDHPLVAAAAAAEPRQAGAAQDLFVAGLGAGGDLDLAARPRASGP